MAAHKNAESSFETVIRAPKAPSKKNATYITVDQFVETCRALVADYSNTHTDVKEVKGIKALSYGDVYIVWLCKTLQNHKGLFATPRADGLYFEITYDGDRGKFYFDVYEKVQHNTIDLNEFEFNE